MLDGVHFATGGAAAGSLRQLCAGRTASCVVELADPLGIGPLRDIDRPSGIDERKRYLRRLFERILADEHFSDLESRIGLSELAGGGPDAARGTVWCGPNADEQVMLRAVCAGWRDRPLHVVDVRAGEAGTLPHRAVGACTVDELQVAEKGARFLSVAERAALAADWERLLRAEHRLRIFDNGQIVGCAEELFDSMLLAACPDEFSIAARVVGQVMGTSPYLIGDSFLDYRLRALIAEGKVEADDATLRLRQMRVRCRPLSATAATSKP